MAHTCPDCGQVCHCGGDIGDCVFDNTKYQNRCTCCVDYDEDDGFYDDDGEDYDDEEDIDEGGTDED